jgi:cysteine synthase A
VIDRMIRVPDAASFGAMHALEPILDRKCGGSTGTNLWAALLLVAEMRRQGQRGSVVSMICDAGDRYLQTYYNADWLAEQQLETAPFCQRVHQCLVEGSWDPELDAELRAGVADYRRT